MREDKKVGLYRSEPIAGESRSFVNFDDDPRYDDLVVNKFFEPSSLLIASIASELAELFIDVGSHTGIYSVAIAKKTSPLEVIAFEPNPLAFSRLVLHVKLNNLEDKIRCINAALGQQSAIGFSNWSSQKGFGWISSGTRVTAPIDSRGKVSLSSYTFPILIHPLEFFSTKYENKKTVIKIDTEGHELGVFQGARGLITKEKPDILLETFSETNASAIENLLPSGYRFFHVVESEKVLIETVNLKPADPRSDNKNIFITTRLNELRNRFEEKDIRIISLRD
jgi:FkbM family methyltransferase